MGLRRSFARRLGDVSGEARWMWLAVMLFLLASVWWLSHDDRVPDWDSGYHMLTTIQYQFDFVHGPRGYWFTFYDSYPPVVQLVGAASIFIAGIHPMTMIMAENLVFVPLMAFGCYGTGRLAAGRKAGLLAGIFALGSPIFVSMMHEYDLDPPQAALVAVTVWAILSSRRFSRLWTSALAGGLLGLALMTKETSVVFVAGPVLVALIRGGWRSWRGLLAGAAGALAVAGPWYWYHHAAILQTFTTIGGLAPNPAQAPPRYSIANLLWYFWNLVNQQTLTIFGLLFFIGALTAAWRCVRHRVTSQNVYPELLAGALVSYLAMTYLTHKDPRYTVPMLVYVAVLGTSWIVMIRRPRVRRTLYGGVIVVAAAMFGGMCFGIGGPVRIRLPGAHVTLIYPHQLTLYETSGWVRGGPSTDGHVLSLLEALRHQGVLRANLDTGPDELDFNAKGVEVLMETAGIYAAPSPLPASGQNVYVFVHSPAPGEPRPCQTLDDGLGIYVARASFATLDASTLRDPANPTQPVTLLCPGRAPMVYRPSA